MANFLDIEQLNQEEELGCSYDLVFVGTPIDERGQASIEKAKIAAKQLIEVHYDQC